MLPHNDKIFEGVLVMKKLIGLFLFVFLLGVVGCEEDSVAPINIDRELAEEVLAEFNYARTNPSAYANYLETLLPYFNGIYFEEPGEMRMPTTEGSSAVQEAINYLRTIDPLPALVMMNGLCKAAADHCADIGPKGLVTHTGTDGSDPGARASRHGTWENNWAYCGENISFGYNDAVKIIRQLVIDDGVPSRGHRENIYRKEYSQIGVACANHSAYNYMCVIPLADGFIEPASIVQK